MTLIFTTIGSAADYGAFGRWLLLTLTVICWGAQFASVSLAGKCSLPPAGDFPQFRNDPLLEPSRWGAAMALYMISFITYGTTLAFYMAVFPRLARNTPHARQLRDKYEKGELSTEEYEVAESLERNRICNTTTVSFWSMPSSPPPILSLVDPQLSRIYSCTLLELGFTTSFERRIYGSKIRSGVVSGAFFGDTSSH